MTEKRALPVSRGLYFEEYEAGQSVTSPGRTISEADVVGFAALSGDWNQIHTNTVYAAGEVFGQRIAHGLLGLSIASGLAVRMGFMEGTVLVFREISEWKFSQPIFIGDTIHVQINVVGTKPVPRLNGGMVTLELQVINQEEKVVQHGTWNVLMKSRP